MPPSPSGSRRGTRRIPDPPDRRGATTHPPAALDPPPAGYHQHGGVWPRTRWKVGIEAEPGTRPVGDVPLDAHRSTLAHRGDRDADREPPGEAAERDEREDAGTTDRSHDQVSPPRYEENRERLGVADQPTNASVEPANSRWRSTLPFAVLGRASTISILAGTMYRGSNCATCLRTAAGSSPIRPSAPPMRRGRSPSPDAEWRPRPTRAIRDRLRAQPQRRRARSGTRGSSPGGHGGRGSRSSRRGANERDPRPIREVARPVSGRGSAITSAVFSGRCQYRSSPIRRERRARPPGPPRRPDRPP